MRTRAVALPKVMRVTVNTWESLVLFKSY
jgi:hypothetical protein